MTSSSQTVSRARVSLFRAFGDALSLMRPEEPVHEHVEPRLEEQEQEGAQKIRHDDSLRASLRRSRREGGSPTRPNASDLRARCEFERASLPRAVATTVVRVAECGRVRRGSRVFVQQTARRFFFSSDPAAMAALADSENAVPRFVSRRVAFDAL